MQNEQDVHIKNFEKWFEGLPEEKSNDIFEWFYSDLRQESGLLISFESFMFECWHFMTLEGSEMLEYRKNRSCLCDDCASKDDGPKIDLDKYHKIFVRWKIANKSLMFDLYEHFYSHLLDEDGEKAEFEFFMFCLWKFTTLEGRDCHISTEQEILESHKESSHDF